MVGLGGPSIFSFEVFELSRGGPFDVSHDGSMGLVHLPRHLPYKNQVFTWVNISVPWILYGFGLLINYWKLY